MFVLTAGAYLRKSGEAVEVVVDGETQIRVPILNLGGIVCFGRVSCSPYLLGLCGERDVALSFLTSSGRFLARVHGFTGGNVLLRRAQYRLADDKAASLLVARPMVQAKMANSRTILVRAAREHGDPSGHLADAAARIARGVRSADAVTTLDKLRGLEGEGARTYFGVFDSLMRGTPLVFRGRNRYPPKDPVNALLSFTYAILMHDVRAACESAGLDPAVGFLHRDRPGRPSLALDLMEELRPHLADRTVLTIINRKQVSVKDFVSDATGAVRLSDEARKTLLQVYQKRKMETIRHPFLDEPTTIGLIPHLQARLLARLLRTELDAYPAMIWTT